MQIEDALALFSTVSNKYLTPDNNADVEPIDKKIQLIFVYEPNTEIQKQKLAYNIYSLFSSLDSLYIVQIISLASVSFFKTVVITR